MYTRIALSSNKKAEAFIYIIIAGFLLFMALKNSTHQSDVWALYVLGAFFLYLAFRSFRTPSVFFSRSNLYLQVRNKQDVIPLKKVLEIRATNRRVNYFFVYRIVYLDNAGSKRSFTIINSGRRLDLFRKLIEKARSSYLRP